MQVTNLNPEGEVVEQKRNDCCTDKHVLIFMFETQEYCIAYGHNVNMLRL